jgi:flagellar motor switch protein FliN
MSEEPVAPPPSPEMISCLTPWAESAGKVLGQIAGGAAVAVELVWSVPAGISPPAENDLCLSAACSGGLRGEMSLRLSQTMALVLAQTFMGETPDAAAEFKPEYREAIEELFRQIAGQVASVLKATWGEVQIRLEAGPPPSWPAASTAWLTAAEGSTVKVQAEIRVSAALAASSRPEQATVAASSSAAPAATTRLNPASEVKLDLLMDVELAATLRFGSRRMLLRDILELNAGAVVELDRQVTEPVDLLLDGRLIARGDVVVVDGNYGLRVVEVMSSEPLAGS